MEVTWAITLIQSEVERGNVSQYWYQDPIGELLHCSREPWNIIVINLRRLPTPIYDRLKQIVGSNPDSTEYNRQVILSEMKKYAASISWYLYKFEDLSHEQAQKLGVEQGLWMLLTKEPTEINFADDNRTVES